MADIEIFRTGKAEGFSEHAQRPQSEEEARKWQQANKQWWNANPNKYDFDDIGEIAHEELSAAWFTEIDYRFLVRDAGPAIGWKSIPFDRYIPYEELRDQDVLEIGTGCGSHAQLLSQHSQLYVGIDITPYAVKCTKARFDLLGLSGEIHEMDAEKMAFPDGSFDFVWSWGVIHHSSDTGAVLAEVARVLRPGGRFVSMVYHRSLWNTWVRGALYYGLLKGELLRGKSVDKILQDSTDGALARYYSLGEWRQLLSTHFTVENTSCVGSKSQLVPLGMGPLKRKIMRMIPDAVGRFITNRPFFGFMIVTDASSRK